MANGLSIAPSDQKVVQHLLWALKPLSSLRGSIPFPFVTTFLSIVLEEGKTQSAYARGAGVNRYVMGRYIHAIGDRGRNGGPGLGLVRLEKDPDHAQKRRIYLTAKGRAIAVEIFHNLRRPRA